MAFYITNRCLRVLWALGGDSSFASDESYSPPRARGEQQKADAFMPIRRVFGGEALVLGAMLVVDGQLFGSFDGGFHGFSRVFRQKGSVAAGSSREQRFAQ